MIQTQSSQIGSRPTEATMRVLWDMQLASRNQTGMGVYAYRVIDELAGFNNVNIETVNGWYISDNWQNIAARGARVASNTLWSQVALPAKVWQSRPDILHIPIYIAPLVKPTKLVVTVHDVIYRRYPEHFPNMYAAYLDWFIPRGLQVADAVISVSEATKQDLIHYYGIPEEKMHVVYNGVDLDLFRPEALQDAPDILAHYGIDRDYVLYVGSLNVRKNVPLLVEAIAILKERNQWGNRLLVIGGSATPGMPGYEAVKQMIERYQLGSDILLTGYIPDEELPALYAAADAFALPSLYEGFGIPLIEAMACGTPVVSAEGSSLTEVVGDAGLLAPNDDAGAFATQLNVVLNDQTQRQCFIERGLERVKKYTWHNAAQQTLDIYKQVLSS